MKLFTLPLLAALSCSLAWADDPVPPALPPLIVEISRGSPEPSAKLKTQVAIGRFVAFAPSTAEPLTYDVDFPARVDMLTLAVGTPYPGIRFDEPFGAKFKHYTWPTAKGPVKILLATEKGDVKVAIWQNGMGDSASPKDPKAPRGPGKVAEYLLEIVAAPIPPPQPDPPPGPGPQPGPGPGPQPAPAQTGAWVIIIADEANPTAQQGKIVDGPTLTALKAAGKCRVYGSVNEANKIAAKKYDVMMAEGKINPPAMLVLDPKGNKVSAGALPMDEATISAKVKEYMKP